MSLESVKAFYQRLAEDEQFRSELSEVKSKEECSHLVQEYGYYFTQKEFENYTAELLESSFNEGELSDLNEKELEAVFGGELALKAYIEPQEWPPKLPTYGMPPMDFPILKY